MAKKNLRRIESITLARKELFRRKSRSWSLQLCRPSTPAKSVVGDFVQSFSLLVILDITNANYRRHVLTKVLQSQPVGNLCQFSLKVCDSTAGLTSHSKMHGGKCQR